MQSESHTTPAPRVGFVSLGCAKALVDSERILTRLKAEGYVIAPSYDGANLVVVNTCGFLDSAKAESLEAIGEAMAANGRVIVTGCFEVEDQRIRDAFPDVLAVTGPHQYDAVLQAIHAAAPAPHAPYLDLVPRAGLRLTPPHYAYLKISEGCNNRCSFCIIPSLRGNLASRHAGDVLAEAEALAAGGVKELLVISQDTSAYGIDLRYAESEWRGQPAKARLTELCEALSRLGVWVRLHYVYPYPHVDELLPLMAEGKILPYLDIPFQHAAPSVLKAMRRPANQEKTLERIARWRAICPDLGLRSTFIVGFPGETEEDFAAAPGLAARGAADPRRLLQIRECGGRREPVPRRSRAGAGEGCAIRTLHVGAARGERKSARFASGQDARCAHRRGGRRSGNRPLRLGRARNRRLRSHRQGLAVETR